MIPDVSQGPLGAVSASILGVLRGAGSMATFATTIRLTHMRRPRLSAARFRRRPSKSPRMLGVLLCYNDGDLVSDAVRYLIDQGHDVIAWDHGSDDETSDILRRLSPELVELRTIPRSFDFYDLYPEMSRHLLADYVDRYDWISWPDQDEFLEGPDRTRSYQNLARGSRGLPARLDTVS